MAYKLFHVVDNERLPKGLFEHLDQAMAEFHRVCGEELELAIWEADDKIVSENLIKIEYGSHTKWFEIEVTENEPNS
ncbi:hypothetical protein V2V72_07730 [Streptococcus agalactiae]